MLQFEGRNRLVAERILFLFNLSCHHAIYLAKIECNLKKKVDTDFRDAGIEHEVLVDLMVAVTVGANKDVVQPGHYSM